ncbi:MAG: tetratricopeptide repeat protein [Nitrospirae bacterium]|nr:tetratricopeptide repeat protein [Candidatus Manganitrophaceae bacterium]
MRKLVELDPKSEITHFGLGQACYDEGLFEEGAASMGRAIAIKPDYTAAYEILGRCLEKIGKLEEARAIYEKGIEIGGQKGDMIPTEKMKARLNRVQGKLASPDAPTGTS